VVGAPVVGTPVVGAPVVGTPVELGTPVGLIGAVLGGVVDGAGTGAARLGSPHAAAPTSLVIALAPEGLR
jgi:hypothetical protein